MDLEKVHERRCMKTESPEGDAFRTFLQVFIKRSYGDSAYSSLPSLASSAAAFSCMAWMSGKAE